MDSGMHSPYPFDTTSCAKSRANGGWRWKSKNTIRNRRHKHEAQLRCRTLRREMLHVATVLFPSIPMLFSLHQQQESPLWVSFCNARHHLSSPSSTTYAPMQQVDGHVAMRRDKVRPNPFLRAFIHLDPKRTHSEDIFRAGEQNISWERVLQDGTSQKRRVVHVKDARIVFALANHAHAQFLVLREVPRRDVVDAVKALELNAHRWGLCHILSQ